MPRTSLSIGTRDVSDPAAAIVISADVSVVAPNGTDVPYPIRSRTVVSGSKDDGDDDFSVE